MLMLPPCNGRQQLEQRCTTLTADLQEEEARASALGHELSETRAELVRISGALHSRRSTDVVDAEREFGEELHRVQEASSREARALRLDISSLQASLDDANAKLRKACEDRQVPFVQLCSRGQLDNCCLRCGAGFFLSRAV